MLFFFLVFFDFFRWVLLQTLKGFFLIRILNHTETKYVFVKTSQRHAMQDLFKVLQTDMLTTYWKIYIEKSQTIYPVCYPFFRRIIFLWAKHLIFCKFLYLIYNYFSLGGGRGVVDEYLLLLISNQTVVFENMSLVLLFKNTQYLLYPSN